MNWVRWTRYFKKMSFILNQVVKEAEQVYRLLEEIEFPGYHPRLFQSKLHLALHPHTKALTRSKTSFYTRRHSNDQSRPKELSLFLAASKTSAPTASCSASCWCKRRSQAAAQNNTISLNNHSSRNLDLLLE